MVAKPLLGTAVCVCMHTCTLMHVCTQTHRYLPFWHMKKWPSISDFFVASSAVFCADGNCHTNQCRAPGLPASADSGGFLPPPRCLSLVQEPDPTLLFRSQKGGCGHWWQVWEMTARPTIGSDEAERGEQGSCVTPGQSRLSEVSGHLCCLLHSDL